MDDKSLRAYMVEMIGTFAVVLISAGAGIVDKLGSVTIGTLGVAVATGLIYAAALAVTVPQSGGYLNPAITLMLFIFKRLDGARCIALILVQVLGAAMAGLALYGLLYFREDLLIATHVGAPQYNTDVFGYGANGSVFLPLLKGMGVEFVLTFLLAFAIFATLLDPRAVSWAGSWVNRLACLWVGLVLGAATVVGLPLTGASLNPARWLGLVVWDRIQNPEAFQFNLIYWIGPLAGALVGGWVYTSLILPPEVEQQVSHQTAPRAGSVPANVTSTLFRAKK